MKRLKLIQRSIIIINICVLLLCSIVNGMDKPKPDPMFIVKGTDSDNGIDISQSTLEMSNTLANMIEGLGSDTTIPIPLNSTTDTIKSVFKILDTYKINPKDNSIQQMIASLSPQHLIQACNFVECLHLKDPEDEIVNNFINGLRQQLVALSPQEIEKNAVVINSLMSEMQKKILRPLQNEAIPLKKIELLKNKGSVPIEKEFVTIAPDFYPTINAFSHDGKIVALGKSDGTIVMFDTQSGNQVKTLTRNGYTYLIKFSHDDKLIMISDNRKTDLWNSHTCEKIQSLRLNEIYQAIFSNDDKFIAASFENQIIIWKRNENADTYTQLFSFSTNGTNELRDFSPDGTCIISTFYKSGFNSSGMCTLWNINEQKALHQVEIPNNPINLRFNLDGSKIIGLFQHQLIIWNAKTLEPEINNRTSEGELYSNQQLSPDGNMRVVNTIMRGQSENFALLETTTNNKICNIDVSESNISLYREYNISFSPNGNMIAFTGQSKINQTQRLLFIINLLTQEDQNKLEELRKLSLIELLKAMAAKKEEEKEKIAAKEEHAKIKEAEQRRIASEQELFIKANLFELNIFNLRNFAAQGLANIRAKISSWWKYWMAKSAPQ